MVIVCGLSFPDSIDAAMGEGEARNMIGRLGQIRRRGTREDVRALLTLPDQLLIPFTNQKVWSMAQLLSFMKISPYISCKKAALNGMGPFFDELEEMQEQATDAVYDLCEDADGDVGESSMVPPLLIYLERSALLGTKYSRNWLRAIIHGQYVIPMYWSSFYKAVCV